MVTKKKSGGGKLSRSEVISVRLDPRLRWGADLASRKQRRTLSSFIEWAVETALETYMLDQETTGNEAIGKTWDVDESTRFAKLAFRFPELLTHTEQILWKLVCENGFLWKGNFDKNGEWDWEVSESKFIYDRFVAHWSLFEKVAKGEEGKEALPTWRKTKIEEDIPF
ncbi:MAG: hypothetical protein OEW39_00505 [Deltaproteobacteria bacterium]|nr:hypothetical protein [Deltaproteobacteria bacterium]